jgi:hypothetical protein
MEVERPKDKALLTTWLEERHRIQQEVIKEAGRLRKLKEGEKTGNVVSTSKGNGKRKFSATVTDNLTQFEIGSYVLLDWPKNRFGPTKPNKLVANWRGPFQVTEQEGNVYTIRNLVTEDMKRVQVHLLKKYEYDPTTTNPLHMAMKEYPEYYVVEKILGHRGDFDHKETLTFEVKWVDYPKKWPTTKEPWHNVRYTEAMREYLTLIGEQKRIPKRIVGEIVTGEEEDMVETTNINTSPPVSSTKQKRSSNLHQLEKEDDSDDDETYIHNRVLNVNSLLKPKNNK